MAVLIGTSAKRTAWKRWLGRCSTGGWANPLFFGKTIGGVPDVAVDAYRALEIVLRHTGYIPKSRWAYNFRTITGSSVPCTCSSPGSCSLHSYGIAVDIDPAENPYLSTRIFSWTKTKFTKAQIDAVLAIKNTKGETVWEWGGYWNTIKDYMHFELRVDPGSTTIDWSTVVGYNKGDDEMSIKKGDPISRACAEAQHAMKQLWGYDNGTFTPLAGNSIYTGKTFGPGEDGDPGSTFEANVIRFQKNVQLPQTGVLDAFTASYLLAKFGGTSSGLSQATADARYAPKAAFDTHIKDVKSTTPHS